MARSEKVAAAVALKQAGYKVARDPAGALVEAVATDAPAAAKLDAGDVIVGAGERTIRTPGGASRARSTSVHPGNDVVLRVRRGGTVRDGDGADGRVAERDRAGRSSGSASRRRPTSSCRSRSTSTSVESAGRRPGSRSRSTCSRSSARTSTTAAASSPRARSRSTERVGPIGGVKQKTFGARRGRSGRVPRAGWGKRGRGTAVCREPSHHPGGEFSTGVVRSADTSVEIAYLQGFCRRGQQPLIAALSFSGPLRPGDPTATMPPVRRGRRLSHRGRFCMPS